MSRMKRFAEKVSEEMGFDGELTPEVLVEADRRLKLGEVKMTDERFLKIKKLSQLVLADPIIIECVEEIDRLRKENYQLLSAYRDALGIVDKGDNPS